MSDLFHEDVPDEFIEAVVRVMVEANWHLFQVLTKRSERMAHMLRTTLRWVSPYTHIWWGVSAENRQHGLPRIRHLQACPMAVRFVSAEPLIEDLGRMPLRGIDWVIVGGESGPGARPMRTVWVKSIQAQCRRAKVPFFFKQWGGTRKAKAGRELDGRIYDGFPVVSLRKVPSPEKRRDAVVAFASRL
jgi:protein gp37